MVPETEDAMTTPPRLTDRPALARNRARVDPTALYLHEEAILEVQERLALVNRRFTAPAIVTPFADLWQNFLGYILQYRT